MSADLDTPPAVKLAEDLTAESLRHSLRVLRDGRRSNAGFNPNPSPDDPYVLAAAVLHVFDPGTIEPFEASTALGRSFDLNRLSTPAIGWKDRRYRSLTASARQSALATLGSRQRMRDALAANPDRQRTGVQVLFEAWLSDTLDPTKLRYSELEELRLLYNWGLNIYEGLPEPGIVDRLRAERARTAIFEHLVDDCFTGREDELRRLRDYVGVVGPALWKNERDLAQGHAAPLVIHGPGGAGKTALIGAFLMEYVEQSASTWFPFIYLAFDNPILDVREPWTLLAAASEQIVAQAGPPGGPPPRRASLGAGCFPLVTWDISGRPCCPFIPRVPLRLAGRARQSRPADQPSPLRRVRGSPEPGGARHRTSTEGDGGANRAGPRYIRGGHVPRR